jgi:aspartate kinase (EC 2.7.2.4)
VIIQFKGPNVGRVPGLLGQIASNFGNEGINIKICCDFPDEHKRSHLSSGYRKMPQNNIQDENKRS